jgi:hypothetical protein
MPFLNLFSLQEVSMSRRLLLALLSTVFIFGFTAACAPPALAVNCDLNACISVCQKRNPQGAAGRVCNSNCMLTMEERKKKGQCK